MIAVAQIDPNDLIDTSGVGWEEALLALSVLGVAFAVRVVAQRLVRSATSRWFDTQPDVAIFLGRLAGWFVVAFGIVAALMILGIQMGPIFLLVALVAVILFLSARSLLENFGAGVVLQTENPFHLGDFVELDGRCGTVQDITGRVTVVDTYDGQRIRIPNALVLGGVIANLSERGALGAEIAIGVEYGTDLDEARCLLLDRLRVTDGILHEPPPEVEVTGFDESSIGIVLRFWHEPDIHTGRRLVDEVARAVDAILRNAGIQIAFPQLVVRSTDTP